MARPLESLKIFSLDKLHLMIDNLLITYKLINSLRTPGNKRGPNNLILFSQELHTIQKNDNENK